MQSNNFVYGLERSKMPSIRETLTGKVFFECSDVADAYKDEPGYEILSSEAAPKISAPRARSLGPTFHHPFWATSSRWSRREGLDG